METKTPVVLVVLVETTRMRWLVAAVGLDGSVAPLLRSEDGDLAAYRGLDFDEQVSFLRHRFCGVVQRGCNCLWPVGKKACQFAFLFEGRFDGASPELLPRVAEHFAEWMLNPPAVVFAGEGRVGAAGLSRLAGTIDRPAENALHASLAPLSAARDVPEAWELSQRRATWQPGGGGG